MGGPGDRYQKVRLLGEGGAGRVWLAIDRARHGARVALKEAVAGSPGTEIALRREFATLASLAHPNLAEAIEFDREAETGVARFTLEYVAGDDVVEAVRREGAALWLDVAVEALRALAFLHDAAFLHRDLKPANLLVRESARRGRRLAVLDFGLAAHGGAAKLVEGGLSGTLPYLAPELFDGEPASRRSDLYGLAAVLFEAMHGRPAFALDPRDTAGFVEAVRAGRRRRPQAPEGYPAAVTAWLETLLSPDPARRPPDATEALARLGGAVARIFAADTETERAARLGSGRPAGRERELASLVEALAPGSEPRVVFLCGGAGSGKTRLIRWLSASAVGDGREVVIVPPDGDPPREAAADRLVVVDEAEGAGARVVEFLDRVARETGGTPARVLAALRPAEARSSTIRKLLRDAVLLPTVRRVELEPLGAEEIAAIAERATGHPPSEARVRWLLAASEGNALAATTVLVEGGWERGGKVARAIALEDSADRRIAGLGARAREWIEALAVLGAAESSAEAGRIAGLDLQASEEAAREAEAAGLVRRAGGRIALESRLVAERVREGMAAERSATLNRGAAELLEGAEDPDPERLARSWFAAGDPDAAVAWANLAGERATKQGRHSDAADVYRFALAALPRRDSLRFDLRRRQAASLFEAGRYAEAGRAYAAAATLAGDDEERARLKIERAWCVGRLGRWDRARAIAESAVAVFEPVPVVLRALADEVVAIESSAHGDAAPSIAKLREVAIALRDADRISEMARAAGSLAVAMTNAKLPECDGMAERIVADFPGMDDASEARILNAEANYWVRMSNSERAQPLLLEVLGRAHKLHNRVLQVWVLERLAVVEGELGRFDAALGFGKEGVGLALALGMRYEYGSTLRVLVETLVTCGRSGEAARLCREWLNGSPSERMMPPLLGFLACALIESGAYDRDEVIELSRRGLELIERSEDRLVTAAAFMNAFRVAAEIGEVAEDIRERYLSFAQQHPEMLKPEIRAEIDSARAKLLMREQPKEALDLAKSAIADARLTKRPELEAVAELIASEAAARLGLHSESEAAVYRAKSRLETAADQIEDRSIRADFLSRPSHRAILEAEASLRHPQIRQLESLFGMIRELNSEADPEKLLVHILDLTLDAVRAERGMILLSAPGEDRFGVRLVRDLEKETADDAEAFSHSIVAKAGAGESVLALDAGSDERFRDLKSVSLFHIRSLMCVPLRSRGAIIGTVYVDSRREGRPFTKDDLRFVEAFADHAALALENARARARLEDENRRLRAVAGERASFDAIVGRSKPMQRVFDLIETIASSELPVLILGESGTGKELVAKAVHFHGSRKDRPFLIENCAAIPETLLESELFGHVRGAFTGADRDRVGLFEQADGGTVFLDEVGDMSAGMQARLLRVLQEGELRRVGGDRTLKVDVRVLAATNKELESEVAAGRFREDLFYRLNVLTLRLPPLRERPGDVALLCGAILERIATERDRPVPRIDSDVLDLLEAHPWPGNVRQLENTLQRLALLAGNGPISASVVDADETLRTQLRGGDRIEPVLSLERTTRDQIRRALAESGGSREKAARMLGISRATIYRKIREYGLN